MDIKVMTSWEKGAAWDNAKQKFIAKYGTFAWMKFKDRADRIAVSVREEKGVVVLVPRG